MTKPWHALQRWRWRLAGCAAVAAFAVLTGRFWHPYYGFTRFIQLDEADRAMGIREIREHPVFTYEGFHGYDGAAYAQIAFHPTLDSPELQPALGNVPYRARRILASALGWVLAGGRPGGIANAYASLNLIVWLALAGWLWRILAVNDARAFVAWAGVMFSAGALHSVRLALTDLLATTLVAIAMHQSERGRHKGAIAALAAAGLARETALAAVIGLWRSSWNPVRAGITNAARTLAVAAPFIAWCGYVHWKAGPAAQGFGNFTWPIAGWLEKWTDTLADFARQPDFRWLNTTTLLALVALTVQAVYILRAPRWGQPWWRIAMSGVVMMLLLGTSVWEGHPGAATRVLLPLGVAFAVVATRERARWPWLLAGSASLLSGILALWHVPVDSRELAAGRFGNAAYVARIGSGWHGIERQGGAAWAWTAAGGELKLEGHPRDAGISKLRVRLRAMTPREVEIRIRHAVAWRGPIGTRNEWIDVPLKTTERGQWSAEIVSLAPPVAEGGQPGARELGVAVYDVELR